MGKEFIEVSLIIKAPILIGFVDEFRESQLVFG